MNNRSVPVSTVLPHIYYRDVAAAIAWLTRVFGFCERYRYGDPGNPGGAQLVAGGAYLMIAAIKSPIEGPQTPAELGYGTQSLTIFLEEVEAHCARSRAFGATIVEEPQETIYGEFQYAALDLEGHHWLFSRHAKDLAPEDWGAITAPDPR